VFLKLNVGCCDTNNIHVMMMMMNQLINQLSQNYSHAVVFIKVYIHRLTIFAELKRGHLVIHK